MTFLVYAFYIVEKGHFYTNRPFYIGKTNSDRLYKRMAQHKFFAHVACAEKGTYKSESELTFLYDAISKFQKKGLTWKYRIIKEFETEQEAFDLEQKLIKLCGRIIAGTGILYNVTIGGIACGGGVMPECTRKKIQQSLLDRNKDFWTEERLNYIKEQYLSGVSIEKIKQRLDIAANTVRKYLLNQGVTLRTMDEISKNHKIDPKTYGWTPEKLQLIKDLYESGKSTREIAKIVDVHAPIICRRLRSLGVVIKKIKSDHGKKSHVKHDVSPETLQECIRLYNEEKLSLHKVVIKLGLFIGVDALRKRLHKLGFKERTREEVAKLRIIKFDQNEINDIKNLYLTNKQIKPIARKFNVTFPTIKRILQEQGVCQYAIQ